MKCHQRQIREAKAATPLPDESDRRAVAIFENAVVREISPAEAKPIILDYEWLGTMGTTRYAVGLFFGEGVCEIGPLPEKAYLAGVACFGNTAGSMVTRSICGPEYAEKVLTLVRGTCVHWAPEHAASYLINKACEYVAARYGFNIFIAYSDTEAGEIGTVYQASNWIYVGQGGAPTLFRHADGREKDSRCLSIMTRTRKGRPDPKACTPEAMSAWKDQMRQQGYIIHDGKTPWAQKGTRAEAKAELLKRGFVEVKGAAKHRYIHFVGDRRTVRALRKALKLTESPYPKRLAV